ncbi:MAG: universal stress protein [Bdellovibrio sp.]|nr:universal stress protein [Bdellovibrio sp.]
MKVMWLYDIFNDDKTETARMVSTLKSLGLNPSDSVQSTYVAHIGEENLAPRADQAVAQSKKILNRKLSENKYQDLIIKPSVIFEDSSSFGRIADAALTEAKKNHIDVIALQTHGKKGFKNFLLGSFAETIIHKSKISMMILSPACKPVKKIKRILFATDLEKGSLGPVIKAAQVAKKAGATLCLFHVPQPNYNVVSDDTASESFKYRKDVHRKLGLLLTAVKKLGVDSETFVDSKWQSTAELILKAAKKKEIDLIMTHAKTGALGNLFLGSTTSRLIRSAHIPVFVLRS